MRFMVTGGSGYIGTHLCRRLGSRAVNIDIRSPAELGEARFRECDVRDRVRVREMAHEFQPQVIFHLAANPGLNTDGLDTQVMGTKHVLLAAAAVNATVVLASSAAVYSLPEMGGKTEYVSEYAIGKYAAEQLLICAPEVRSVALRLGNVYGPPWPKGVVASFASAARLQKAPLITDPGLSRDFVHVNDVCDAFKMAAQNCPELPHVGLAYDVCTGVETTLHALWGRIAKMFDRPEEEIQHGTPRRGDRPRGGQDPAPTKNDLGWHARTSLEEGLAALI